MGRTKVKIEKLPSEAQRKVTYGKRSKGLIKKAREISILTDVDVSLIMFSCTGKLDHFTSQQPGIWKILQRFIHNIPDNERMQISQDTINTINMLAEQHESANQSREEIKKKSIDDDIHQMLLQLRNRMMHPSGEAFKSQEQFSGLIQSLENIRQTVVNRTRMQMQQTPGVSEAGMRGPLQVRQQIQQQGVQSFGVGDPLTSSNSAQSVNLNVGGSSNVDMSKPLPGGHQEWMPENIILREPWLSGYTGRNFSTGLQNIRDFQSLHSQTESVLVDIPDIVFAPLPEECQEQNTLQGMDFSGGVQTTVEQQSSNTGWNNIYAATDPNSSILMNFETFNWSPLAT